LVPLSLIKDDFFVFDESRRNLVGRRTRRMIRLGDNVVVQVARVDTAKKQVDFGLAAEARKSTAPKTTAPPKAAQPQRPPPLRATAHRPFDDRPQPSRPSPRPQAKRSAKPAKQSPPTDARKTDARPAKFSSSAARPQFGSASKPMFKTSVRTFGGGNNKRRRK
jgi:hypothetical protein